MKRKTRSGIAAAVLVLAVAFSSLTGWTADAAGTNSSQTDISDSTQESTTSAEMSKAAQELESAQGNASSLESQKKTAQQRLASLEDLQSDAAAYLEALDANLTEVQQNADELAVQMEQKESQIEQAQELLDQAKEQASDQYEAMKLRIQYMYEAGETRYLDILFEADSLMDLLNRAEYIQELIAYDRDMLAQYEETCQAIADTEELLEEQYADLELLLVENAESQADLQTLMDAKTTEMESYTAQISSVSSEVDEYTKAIQEQENLMRQIEADIARQEAEERQRQEEEAKRLQEEEESRRAEEETETDENGEPVEHEEEETTAGSSSGSSSGGSSSTSFIWPLPNSNTTITSYFGSRESPTEGASSNHQGIDIAASTGTKIYAAAAGTVVISQYSVSAGYYIMINHGNGVYTVYMHCSQLLVSVGESVSQGQNIALVGSTGYSTGPHLHFGVRIDGVYVNPLSYVSIP